MGGPIPNSNTSLFLQHPKKYQSVIFYSHKSVIFCGRVYLQKYNLPCDIFVCQTLRDGGRTICNYEERVRRERGRELSFMQGSTFKNRIFLEVCFFSENWRITQSVCNYIWREGEIQRERYVQGSTSRYRICLEV